ncbi:Uncharacterized protein SCF082_LOCUS33844 [Durusdinium trenchii]|uniref:Uncharacterized protein n=1 Tax=Durusdinium trenchii TaxID=1381693 RepID=A0ABP0NRU9_9DINO
MSAIKTRHSTELKTRSTEEAMKLHEDVDPSRWCITFDDLKFFQSEVHRVIQDGETFNENFEPSYGPSIYAVNEHYIKPVTAAAGKMSWALMMNPDGLDCDLFITHAWQEDVFEFTDKVLTSWPWRANHAWCCMLANPQNLDIGALLQSPSSSPFALALQSSKYMLVVPNRHKSVYTRLWCGYEAYLAFQSNKIIRTATPPIGRQVLLAWLRMLPALLIGATVGLIFRLRHFEAAQRLILILRMLSLFASLVSQHCGQMRLCLIANHLGLASGVAAIIGGELLLSGFSYLTLVTTNLLAIIKYASYFCIVLYFLLAEVDRVSCQIEAQEAEALQHHYQGSIRHASCSEVQDEVNIRNEIGDQVDEVDKVIQVLLKAGMTSDALRDAHLQGVELRHAGFVQLAIPVLVLGPLLMLGCWLVGRYIYLLVEEADPIPRVYTLWACIETESVLARFMFLGLFCRSSIDERCFMLNVMAKIVTVFYFCLVELGPLGNQAMFSILLIVYCLSFLAVLVFSALGIRGTLKLPCGRLLAQFFVSRLSLPSQFHPVETESSDLASASDDASSSGS